MMPPPHQQIQPAQQSYVPAQQQQPPQGYVVGQSPHYGGNPNSLNETGTTSEDSDDSALRTGIINPLKRPSPEPLPTSPNGTNKTVKSPTTPTSAKKPKAQRKKKKNRDPNEPQKPVSAYALFFRDTQAAIKGQNPAALFGEVSTIVASMWDVLAPEHKEVYKKKTETAKKEYLKTLAAYRASNVASNVSGAETNAQPQAAISPQPTQPPQIQPPQQQQQPPLQQPQQQPQQQQSPAQYIPQPSPQQQSPATYQL